MLSKGLFAVAPKPEAPAPPPGGAATYEQDGFQGAAKMRGTVQGLQVCLDRLYQGFMAEVQGDHKAQNEVTARIESDIAESRGKMEKHTETVRYLRDEKIPDLEKREEQINREIRAIKEDPSSVRADAPTPVSFWIGTVILVCLSLYLFVFYSSASYSAFFKQFTAEEIAVANSIFDAQAFGKALRDGVAELALILMMPSVFIGLGFLIHKFQEQEGAAKYVKIATLVAVTFVFDAILAYEITLKIAEVKALSAFQTPEPYTLADAAVNVQFWLIIFAGFVVYLIWGFVFDFTMEEQEKLDAVRLAIRARKTEIEEVRQQKKAAADRAETLRLAADNLKTEIDRLRSTRAILPVDGKEFRDRVSQYMEGWVHWLNANLHSDAAVREAVTLRDSFLTQVLAPLAERGDGARTVPPVRS